MQAPMQMPDAPPVVNSQEQTTALSDAHMEPSKITKRTRFQVKQSDINLDQIEANESCNGIDNETGSDNVSNGNAKDAERAYDDDNVAGSYDTQYLKSLRYYTREPLPRAAHYRNTLTMHTHHDRPTLDQLHDPSSSINHDSFKNSSQDRHISGEGKNCVSKMGWIEGVFIRCLLNIWGVMLFLRLPWAVGQAGVLNSILIVLLATLVTGLTTVSMSAICTNGEVKGGGAYYMISRSLGPEFGGAIGAIFSLANAVAVSMYVVGFCESFIGLMVEYDFRIIDAGIQDIRLIGLIVVTILLLITVVGMEWESKTQQVLLVILLASIFSFIYGIFAPTNEQKMSKGFFGIQNEILVRNFMPDYRNDMTFINVFAVIFPAATGILAGANISGDLANPSKSIPKGTFLAILITTFTYVLFMILCGWTTLRDANGMLGLMSVDQVANCSLAPDMQCKYGLHNSDQIIMMISPYSSIIYAGVFAASLSSALASLVSAPKIFQALCNDNLFPYIGSFGKGYGPTNEPRRAYFLTYVIAIGCILIGQLNLIAPIISNFFLAAYCIINFSCFHVSFTNSPGFRPAFRWYNKWISLIGAALCFVVMLISSWTTAIITIVLVMFLYIYILYRKPNVNWGSSDQAGTYMRALRAVKRTVYVPDHVKNYRPQILVLTGCPSHRPALLDFANLITKKISLLICGDVHTEPISAKTRRHLNHRAFRFLEKRKIEAFYEVKQASTFSEGTKAFMELCGLGKLKPNIILIGYKSNWFQCSCQEIVEYFKTIHHAFDLHLSVCVLRIPGGFDFGPFEASVEQFDANEKKKLEQEDKHADLIYNVSDKDIEAGFSRNPSGIQLSSENSPCVTPAVSKNNINESKSKEDGGIVIDFDKHLKSPNELQPDNDARKASIVSSTVYQSNGEEQDIVIPVLTKDLLANLNQFHRKQRKGTIDVWWLYDDGGLTMLIPYLLSTRSQYENCILRVFTLANRKNELDREKRNMASLLSKFRIDFQDVTVIPDIMKAPKPETVKEFENLIAKFQNEDMQTENMDCFVRESEMKSLKDKCNRHMRLRELLLEHSTQASLIVMTLTVPRKGVCSAPMFLSWLELLTKNMPPFLLVRGNQSSVLTFYS